MSLLYAFLNVDFIHVQNIRGISRITHDFRVDPNCGVLRREPFRQMSLGYVRKVLLASRVWLRVVRPVTRCHGPSETERGDTSDTTK